MRLELAAVGEVTGGEDHRLPAEEAHGAFGRLGGDAGDAPVVLDQPARPVVAADVDAIRRAWRSRCQM